MSIYKRVAGNLVIQTVGATDTVTFEGLTANTAAVVIDGDLSVSGNVTIGNIAADKIFNGTSSIEIPSASGNAIVSIGGVSNVFVVTTTGTVVTGTSTVSGNLTTGNISTTDVVSNNITAAGNITLTRSSTATTSPIIRFSDSNTVVTSLGSNIGAVEWFTSDSTGGGARVTAAIKAVYADTSGNANILIQSANSNGGLINRITVLGATGNVGVANSAPMHTLAVSGTMYGSSTLNVAGNVTGGNVITTGLISATGNVTGANLRTTGLISATGNITGGNLSVTGSLVGGAGGVSVTGNITGGNLIINGVMSASGNLSTTDIAATTLSATGNITGGNIKTLGISNVGTSIVTATQTVTGNISGGNISTAGLITATGAITSTANVTGGNLRTGGLVSAAGNVISAPGGFFIGDGGLLSNITVVSNVAVTQLASGTTNFSVQGAGGNLTATIGGVANTVTFFNNGVNITGAFSAAGNVIGANVNSTGTMSATGNITGGNVSAATGTFTTVIGAANASNLTTGTVPSDRLTGQYTININGTAVTANTVATAAQPNITSVGILTSVSVTGNVTAGNLVTNGAVTGNGRALTSLNATNINTGTLAQARLANAAVTLGSTALTLGATVTTVAGLTSVTSTTFVGALTGAATTAGTVTTAAQPNITSVGTLTSVSVSGTVTGGNVSTTGFVSATGNVTGGNLIASGAVTGNGRALTSLNATNIDTGTLNAARLSGTYTITVSGSATTAGTVTTAAQPNITSVGTLSSLSATGNITGGNLITAGLASLSSIVKTGANAVGNIGSTTNYFNRVFATATSALYADLAEKFLSDQPYAPGTVLIFGGEQEVTQSVADQDYRVAGVVSTNPSYVMNSGLSGNYVVDLALQGRVPCAVVGPVQKGDLMVSAADGRAKAVKNAPAGTIIGKSLENFSGTDGTIEIVVGRD